VAVEISALEGAVMTVECNQDETTRLRQLILGFRITKLICVAAKLELPNVWREVR